MKLVPHSYHFSVDVLKNEKFRKAFEEAEDILKRLPLLKRVGKDPTKTPKFPISQKLMNNWLDDEFEKKGGWERHPRIMPKTKLEGDFLKDRVQIEVQFGNMARWTYDVFKFQASYSLDKIDVGILVVPMQWFAALIGDNIAYHERVLRELPHAKLSITLPILVLGLDPEDDPEFGPKKAEIQRLARITEQWDSLFDFLAANVKEAMSKKDMSDRLHSGEWAKVDLPEDFDRKSLDKAQFKSKFDKVSGRKKYKARFEKAPQKSKYFVLEAGVESEEEES